jgi:YD repeat-containing protein
MAAARSRLRALPARGPRGLRAGPLLSALFVLGLVSSVAAATAVANCGFIESYPVTGSYGAVNPAEPDIRRCFLADPINCATGNLTETQVDLAVQGHGPPLQMVRAYNSQLAASQSAPGPLGYGWTASYSAKLTFTFENTIATVTHDNGSTISFVLSGTQWNAPPWTQATFAQVGSNYVYTEPSHTKLEFNSSGRLLKITDRHGLSLTLSYNGSGRLESVADESAFARQLTFTYSTSGQLEKVTDPMGRAVKYTYSSGDLASVTLPDKETPRWKFGYNEFHEMTSLTNGRGHTTTTTYNASHRAATQTDPLGRKYTFKYEEVTGGTQTTITEPNGATTLQKFNEAGSPLSISRAVGTALEATREYTYSGAFKPTSATDPNGHVTSYTYDGSGNKLTEKDPNGNETVWTYNSSNDVVSVTNPKGQVTSIIRNAVGDPTEVTRVIGASVQKVTLEYNSYGDLIKRTDPVGRVRVYTYDVFGRGQRQGEYVTSATAENLLRKWKYNLNSEVVEEIDGRGLEPGNEEAAYTTKITRDALGRPTTSTDPLGNTVKTAYDANGNVSSVTDGNGNVTTYVYDSADQRTELKAATGATTKITYTALGRVATRSNGNGNVTEYKYDLLGRNTEIIDPLGRKSVNEYDDAGNLRRGHRRRHLRIRQKRQCHRNGGWNRDDETLLRRLGPSHRSCQRQKRSRKIRV